MQRLYAGIVGVALLLAFWTASAGQYVLLDDVIEGAEHAEWRAQAVNLKEIYQDLSQVSGVEATVLYSSRPEVNAFATELDDGEKVIVVLDGLVELMKHDRDAVAAVVAHELAHHKAEHLHSGRGGQWFTQVLGALLGAAAQSAVAPELAGLAGSATESAVSAGGHLVAMGFSRDQEYEADHLGVNWLVAAGYNPDGMLRMQNVFAEMSDREASIFDTHPTGERRYRRAEEQIAALDVSERQLSMPVEPLADEIDLDLSLMAVQERMSSRPTDGAQQYVDARVGQLSAGRLDLAGFAALENALDYAGAEGRDQLLAEHGMDEEDWQALSGQVHTLLAQYEDAGRHHWLAYLEATEGPMTPYAEQVIDYVRYGRPLRDDPPFDLATAARLHAEEVERGLEGEHDHPEVQRFEDEVLESEGLSYYDYSIGYHWWDANARMLSRSGDRSIFDTLHSHDTSQ